MKKKKYFLLIITILFFSGCSVEYNLMIDKDGKIEENISILQENKLLGSSMTEVIEQLDWSLIFASDEIEPAYFYNKEKLIGEKKSGLKYFYNFDSNNFISESEILKNCYEEYNLVVSDERLDLYAGDFKCKESLGSGYDLTVNITVDGELIDGNFTSNSKNKYTWKLNENNSDYITLSIDRTKINRIFNTFMLIVIVISVILLAGGIFLFGYCINKKNNKL